MTSANLETVQEITNRLKTLFKTIGYFSVRGELSNLKISKGHCWFELLHLDHPKTNTSQTNSSHTNTLHTTKTTKPTTRSKKDKINGVIWNATSPSSPDHYRELTDGQIVVIDASIQTFGGHYYLNTSSLTLDRDHQEQTLQKKYQELYTLYQPFFELPKKTLPVASSLKHIGLVTGSGSDALHDIINISYRRNPTLRWTISSSLVQGSGAPDDIIASIKRLKAITPPLQAIVISRGGGSYEDLWSFNDPTLIEYLSKITTDPSCPPIVTGIGHQMDVTLSDHISAIRMSTPSAAAERVSYHLSGYVQNLHSQIMGHFKNLLPVLPSPPPSPLQKALTTLDHGKRFLTQATALFYQQLEQCAGNLDYSPLLAPKPLPPGTCQITRCGRPFKHFSTLKQGDRLQMQYLDQDQKVRRYQIKIMVCYEE